MEPDVVNVGRHKDLTTETGPTGVGVGQGERIVYVGRLRIGGRCCSDQFPVH